MVDRYKSIVEEGSSRKKNNRSSLLLQNNRGLNQLIKKTQAAGLSMKQYIQKYRQATTSQEQREVLSQFKREQEKLQDSRRLLTKQFKQMNAKQADPEKLLLKEHLLRTVQKQMKLDVQMNEMVSKKQHQLEINMKKLQVGSEKLKNALSDLNQKRNQIIYLQQQVKECVQLLQIIGVLVFENSEKIEMALQQVKKANYQIDRSLKKIQTAKMKSERSRKIKCCIIILGLVVIIVILISLFGLGLFS